MRSRLLTLAIAIILLVCIACPVSEMFDRWDHTLKTGKDTESSVMILAVCVGAVISISLGDGISLLHPEVEEKRILPPARLPSKSFMIVSAVARVSQPPPLLRI